MDAIERMVGAFPSAMAREAGAAARAVTSLGATLSPDGFSVIVGTELVTIPERLYVEERNTLASGEGLVACLYTRHHDGFVRQRALERVLRLDTSWAVPFIVRLVGEYVIEIIEQINDVFAELPVDHLRAFVLANPDFIRLTRDRVTSYWDCYFRTTPHREHVGFQLMDRIEAGAMR